MEYYYNISTDEHFMLKQIFLGIVNFEPVAWVIDIFKLFLTGRFIFLTILYCGFVFMSFHNGYMAKEKLDKEYGLSQSADYISISRGQCTAYYDIKDLNTIVKLTKGMQDADCSKLTDGNYVAKIYDQHMNSVRGANDDSNIWVYIGAFFLFMCIMYMNTNPSKLYHEPKKVLVKYCVLWMVYAAMLYPSTYGVYGAISSPYDDTGVELSVSSGKITNDGHWMYQYQSYFGELKNTKIYDIPRDM